MALLANVTKQYPILSGGLISTAHYMIILEYASVMGAVIASFGMIANMIIIKTFVAMRVKDGVTVSFLALAIFDMGYLIAGVALGVTVMFYLAELMSIKRFPIEPYGVSIYFTNVMILINITNVLTTTFLAVGPSMCVARPLQFKNTFTRCRAIIFMNGFAVFAIAIYTPIFANMGMRETFNKFTNTSRPCWWGSAGREYVKEMVWFVTDMFLPVASEFIIIMCVIILSNSLMASSRFRQSSVVSPGRMFYESPLDSPKTTDSIIGKTTVDKLAGKDVRVVQQVVLISAVYVACTIPKLLISLISTIETDFAIGGRYVKLYMSTNGLRKHFEVLNSAVNLIIYYKYNTKFQSTLLNSPT